MAENAVLYRYGLKEKYLALEVKDSNTLYWCTDTQELYKGNLLFAVGKEASATAAGLLSAEDKIKLDALSQGAITFNGVYESLDEVTNPAAGDIVIIGTKEYIYDGNRALWVELGDEGIYITKAEAEAEFFKKQEAEELKAELDKEIAAAKVASAGASRFEVISAVPGYLVNEAQNDMRIYIPEGSEYTVQDSGEGADSNSFYIHLRAWAPSNDITACRKGNPKNYDTEFLTMEEVTIDPESGRVYVDFWLPIAVTSDGGATWTEYATMSADGKYIGWDWLIEWYSAEGLVASSYKHITLVANFDMLYNGIDWYVPTMQADIATLKETAASLTWQPIGG